MRVSTLLSSLILTAQSVASAPLLDPSDPQYADANLARAFDDEAFNRLLTRQTAQILTTGANTTVAPRLELRQLYSQQPNQWTLLILGLEAFHAQSQSSDTSFFGVAGIHGVPRQDWNGISNCGRACSNTDGYCPHDMCIFPTWHRAYMALFEQQFLAAVNQIANNWTLANRATMQAAAARLRFPYYDWAAAPAGSGPAYPTQMSDRQITINAQNGQRTLNNPLAAHTFTNPRVLGSAPFSNWQSTLKYPSSTSTYAKSQDQNAANAIANNRRSLRDQLYQLFTTCTNYAYFSNDAADSSSTTCANSLEGIHNTVHSLIGGGSRFATGGHMSYLSFAAFDPAFWLHHMNVDRIFALWQGMNPDWTCNQYAPHSTWTIASNTLLNQDYPLMPFRSSNNNFWTSNQVKDWRVFNYDYPEFANSDRSPAAIKAFVNRLYAPNATFTAGSSKREASLESLIPGAIAQLVKGTTKLLQPLLQANNGSNYQYVANIRTPRYALNGSYVVYCFDGPPAQDSSDAYATAPNLIGPLGVFSMPNMQSTSVDVTGSIPLTSTLTDLVAAGKLPNLSPAIAVPYLQRNLEWRIVGPNGERIEPEVVPGFKVAVYSSTSSPLKDEFELPRWSRFIPLPDITKLKSGGATAADIPRV